MPRSSLIPRGCQRVHFFTHQLFDPPGLLTRFSVVRHEALYLNGSLKIDGGGGGSFGLAGPPREPGFIVGD